MRKYLPYVPGILTRLCYVLLKKWKEINKKALILFLSLLFLWIFFVPIGLAGMYFLCAIKEWKAEWKERKIAVNYYNGIHLCRVGYEGVTQAEIKRIKLLLQ